jgi:hypothetical protein
MHLQGCQLAEAATGQERGLDQLAELALRGVDQTYALGDREVPHAGGIGFFERLDATPRRQRRESCLVALMI